MLSLTDAELAQLERVAGDEPPAAYARQVVLRHLDAKRRKRRR